MWAQQWALLEEVSLQINDWFIFVVYTLFTFAVINFNVRITPYLFKKSIRDFKQYGFKKAPPRTYIDTSLSGYVLETITLGLFMGIFSVWFLFFSENNLLNYFEQVLLFFK